MELYRTTYEIEKIYTYDDLEDPEPHIKEMEHKNYTLVSENLLPAFMQGANVLVFKKTIEEYGKPEVTKQ